MGIDRRDFDALTKRYDIAPTLQKSDVGSLRVIERDALQAQHLTSQPSWDRFLTYLQAALQRLDLVRQSAQAKLNAIGVVDHHSLISAKLELHVAEAQIELLESIMSMPKEIIENGDKARDLLEKIGATHAA